MMINQAPAIIGITEMIGMIEIKKKALPKGNHRMKGWHVNNEKD